MKSVYVKPAMSFEMFQPTEYVAACYGTLTCVGNLAYSGYNNGSKELLHTCPLGANGGNFPFKDDQLHEATAGVRDTARKGSADIGEALGTALLYYMLNGFQNWDDAAAKAGLSPITVYKVGDHYTEEAATSYSNSSI